MEMEIIHTVPLINLLFEARGEAASEVTDLHDWEGRVRDWGQ